jgi:D-arabinose 1-dehydrogenase-like Zn-dependent alcohol dehydrogenase
MRSVLVSGPRGTFEIVERDIPEPGPMQVRIKVQSCGIWHSDSFTKEGLFPDIQYPREQ